MPPLTLAQKGLSSRYENIRKNGNKSKKALKTLAAKRSKKTKRQLDFLEVEAEKTAFENRILANNESVFALFSCPIKGKAVKSLKKFEKGDFVLEYKGV